MNKNPKFDREAFKRAIAGVESSGGVNLSNPNSSAAGRYQFLYKYIQKDPLLKGISKREFINRPDLHEKIMDKAIDGTLTGYKGYARHAKELKEKYNTNLREDEIAALTHFLGAGGVKEYLSNPDEYRVPGVNSSVEDYVSNFNKYQGTTPSFETDMNQGFADKNYAPPIESSLEGVPMNDEYDFQQSQMIPEIYSNPNEGLIGKDLGVNSYKDSTIYQDQAPAQNFLSHLNNSPYQSSENVNQPTENADIPMDNTVENPAVESNAFAQGGFLGNIINSFQDGGLIDPPKNGPLSYQASLPDPDEMQGPQLDSDYLTIGNPGQPSDNDLVEFQGGGTHEQNSLGGIPQGMGSNGKLNTVEEGESKWSFDDGDYVFSNRINI